jgi:hypothetical protein
VAVTVEGLSATRAAFTQSLPFDDEQSVLAIEAWLRDAAAPLPSGAGPVLSELRD